MFVGYYLRRKNYLNKCKEICNYSSPPEPDYVDLPENDLSVKNEVEMDKFEEDVKSFSSSSESVDSSSSSSNYFNSSSNVNIDSNSGPSLHSLSTGRI
jgi:hypothetical protein